MKYFIFSFTFVLFYSNLFGQSKPVTIDVNGKQIIAYDSSFALIIGISNYKYLKKLPGVLNDVIAVKEALSNNGFTVSVKTDLNKLQMEDAINDFISLHGQALNNRLLIYFAGHGYTMLASYGDELGYFAPVDAPKPSDDAAGFVRKSINMEQIQIYARNIQSKHAMFLFDACFAGSIFAIHRSVSSEAAINYKTKEPVRQFITSGSADEEVPDISIFRQQFVTAITTTYADNNNDFYLTCTELGEFLQEKVISYSRDTQHPQYGTIKNPNLDKGDFVFKLPDETDSRSNMNSIIDIDRTIPPNSIKDIEGNTYKVVIIGDQTWMAENLKVTKYNDGNAIPLVTEEENWRELKTAAYCWYDNDEAANKNTYGALYNWYAVNTGKLCPTGWHVPTDDEWKKLEIYLGMSQSEADKYEWRGTDEGNKLKSTTGWNKDGNGTDMVGFTALSSGTRTWFCFFAFLGWESTWWSRTVSEFVPYPAFYRTLDSDSDKVYRRAQDKGTGNSVRCVRD